MHWCGLSKRKQLLQAVGLEKLCEKDAGLSLFLEAQAGHLGKDQQHPQQKELWQNDLHGEEAGMHSDQQTAVKGC